MMAEWDWKFPSKNFAMEDFFFWGTKHHQMHF